MADVYAQGGAGGRDLAEKAVAAAADAADPSQVRSLYESELSILDKVERVAREIYAAGAVYVESEPRKKLARLAEQGFGRLPVCIAKTQSSFSDNPKLLGAPSGWTLTVNDAHLAAGAGFVVVIAGNMLLMPGLGKSPQAVRMDVDERGNITGVA